MDFEILKTLYIEFDEVQKEKFLKYVDAFKIYNAHTNLISKNDEELLSEKHIFDSLAFNLYVRKYGLRDRIMDIGTGGGFPSVPLALLYDNMKVFAVDSTSKKINFIKKIKSYLNLQNLEPVCSRIENLPSDLKNGFDVVTTRALGSLPMVLEYAIPFLKKGGHFIAYKSKDSDNELKQSENALKLLKTKLVDIIEYKLPLKENFDRKLLVFEKLSDISTLYPRAYNVIKKSPL